MMLFVYCIWKFDQKVEIRKNRILCVLIDLHIPVLIKMYNNWKWLLFHQFAQ